MLPSRRGNRRRIWGASPISPLDYQCPVYLTTFGSFQYHRARYSSRLPVATDIGKGLLTGHYPVSPKPARAAGRSLPFPDPPADRGVADTTPLPSAIFPARCSFIQLNKLGSGMPTRRLGSSPACRRPACPQKMRNRQPKAVARQRRHGVTKRPLTRTRVRTSQCGQEPPIGWLPALPESGQSRCATIRLESKAPVHRYAVACHEHLN